MCELIKIGDSTAFICRGNHDPVDHKCNEDATVYELRTGQRITLSAGDKKYYEDNYKEIVSGSVACSICGRTAIDMAHYL